LRGDRFTCDNKSPFERFRTLETLLGSQIKGCEINSCRGCPYGLKKSAHSVLTVDRVDNPNHPTARALEEVLEFLEQKLKPGGAADPTAPPTARAR
jgi:hypothetical protein